jgi:uncharacterized protein (TIGR02246 family)
MAEKPAVELYRRVLAAWNNGNAEEMASPFAEFGSIVGFDGSMVNGRTAIRAHLAPIFKGRPTPAYVAKIREVRPLGDRAALLRAVVGMIPPAKTDINPELNAVQTLVAARHGPEWQIEIFQNTPAAFHGRPQEAEDLSAELRAVFQSHRLIDGAE